MHSVYRGARVVYVVSECMPAFNMADLQSQQHQGLPSTRTPLASDNLDHCLQQHSETGSFLSTSLSTDTHTHTHTHTNAVMMRVGADHSRIIKYVRSETFRSHARTHARTHARIEMFWILFKDSAVICFNTCNSHHYYAAMDL